MDSERLNPSTSETWGPKPLFPDPKSKRRDTKPARNPKRKKARRAMAKASRRRNR